MSTRVKKVQQIVIKALSEILHTDFREESVRITLSGCSLSPDLKDARVFYSVLGTDEDERKAAHFFKRFGGVLRKKLGPRLHLKYLPRVRFEFDPSLKRGARTLDLMDQIDSNDNE